MSLLDGPDTVTVIPMTQEKDRYGTYKLTRGEPIVVEGVSVSPFGRNTLGNLESDFDGPGFNDQHSIRGRGDWPGGIKSIIVFNGVEFDQEGLPKEFNRGVRTKHFVVRMSRRSAEVK